MEHGNCTLCPRGCNVDRSEKIGYCGAPDSIKLARAALHFWEEPHISGTRGSGTVFFSHCALKCVYCQNREISLGGFGKAVSIPRLADIFLELQQLGAHNINLVTASHYLTPLLAALDIAKPKLSIPIVYNCGGYESVSSLKRLAGYIDIYLPDFKYCDSALALRYSNAPDYFAVATAAVLEMHRQQPTLLWDGALLQRGLNIRHMVLPGAYRDSVRVIDHLGSLLPTNSFLLSLMSQFTPTAECAKYPELNRRVTTFEYKKAVDAALALGLNGVMQERSSAKEEYRPPFNLEGV